MAVDRGSITTFKEAGVIPPPDQQLYLLPLHQPKVSSKAPLERLPPGNADKRVAFTTNIEGNSIEWIASTHVFPSAYPRSHYASTAPPSAPLPESDVSRAKQNREEERESRKGDLQSWGDMSQVYSVESFYPPSSEEEAQRLADQLMDAKQPQIWSCVERIAPKQPIKGGITLFLAHANGFHKEIYEPFVLALISNLAKQGRSAPQISEIWSIDTFNSGDAAALNRGSLGQATSWFDHPRDMLQFLDFYIPKQGANVTTLLEAHAQGETRKDRTMVGIGHSFSGAGMLMLNSIYPEYFTGLIVVDPVGHALHSLSQEPVPKDNPMANSAVARKEMFTDRRSAEVYLKSKPFFQSWDPRVLALHVRFAFRPVHGHEEEADPPVTLSMSKWSEALAFSTSYLGDFGYAQVKRSRFSGWAHLVCTSDGGPARIFGPEGEGPEELQAHFVKSFSTTGRASTEIIQGGHLMVQEQPDLLGARLAEVMSQYAGRQQSSSRSRL